MNRGYLADYALAPEPTHMGVLRSRLGLLFIKLTTRGEMVRACFPDKGKTALAKMIDVVTALEKEFNPRIARHTRVHEDAVYAPGFSVGAIEAGWPYKPWASPAVCSRVRRLPHAPRPHRARRGARVPRVPGRAGRARLRAPGGNGDLPLQGLQQHTGRLVRLRLRRRHFESLIGPYERCTSPLASYSDDTCIMREQAMEAVVFGAGGVRYRGEADGQGIGVGRRGRQHRRHGERRPGVRGHRRGHLRQAPRRAEAPGPVGGGSRVTGAPERVRRVAFTVNGEPRAIEVEARRTLAEALRLDLGLTGTKVGCNRAECGSCTVVLDGRAVFACTVLAVEAAGRAVGTVEGLAGPGGLHPLQVAFIEHDAVQCGICIPGILMSLKALLDAVPSPTEDDVRDAVAGNLCRCGTYANTVRAAMAAARELREGAAA